ncbi:MAG: glycosyltransferase [Bryobacteraceae bacterium]
MTSAADQFSTPAGITVVIPTLNRCELLSACIRDLLAQSYRPLEILVVDQSDQCDSSIPNEGQGVVSYHHVPFRGLPKARNYGWKRAKYDAILFLDDDVRCHPGLLAEHIRCLQLPGVGIVAGAVEETRKQKSEVARSNSGVGHFDLWTATPARAFSAQGEFDVDHAPGGNFSAWRAVLELCGGVDEAMGAGAALYEETDFCLRAKQAGYRVRFNGLARLTHLAAPRGGCRVPVPEDYVRSLAHNRAIMIRRHLTSLRYPVAFARLLITGASFSFRHRNARILNACLAGAVQGFRDGSRAPICTASDDLHCAAEFKLTTICGGG